MLFVYFLSATSPVPPGTSPALEDESSRWSGSCDLHVHSFSNALLIHVVHVSNSRRSFSHFSKSEEEEEEDEGEVGCEFRLLSDVDSNSEAVSEVLMAEMNECL